MLPVQGGVFQQILKHLLNQDRVHRDHQQGLRDMDCRLNAGKAFFKFLHGGADEDVYKRQGDETATNNGFTNVTKVTAQADALMEVASGTADACIIDLTMAKAMTGDGTSYADLSIAAEMDREEYGIGFRKGSDTAPVSYTHLDVYKRPG